MSRHGYAEGDDDWCEDGDCGECPYCDYRARVDEARRTPEGQRFLKEMITAVAQEPGLCSGVLLNMEGAVCAIGAVLKQRGTPMEPEEEDDYSEWAADEIALMAEIPEELAQEIMYENDEWGGDPASVKRHMLAWAKAGLEPDGR